MTPRHGSGAQGDDLDELLATIPRGERGELRIRRCTYNGSRPYVDIRHWFPDERTEELRPGKGVTIKDGELLEVIQALQQLLKQRDGQRQRQPSRPQQNPKQLTNEELAADAELF